MYENVIVIASVMWIDKEFPFAQHSRGERGHHQEQVHPYLIYLLWYLRAPTLSAAVCVTQQTVCNVFTKPIYYHDDNDPETFSFVIRMDKESLDMIRLPGSPLSSVPKQVCA